jgi:hypothetical protein
MPIQITTRRRRLKRRTIENIRKRRVAASRKIKLLCGIKVTVRLRSSGDWLAWLGHRESWPWFPYPWLYAFGNTEEEALLNLVGAKKRKFARVKRITWRPTRAKLSRA